MLLKKNVSPITKFLLKEILIFCCVTAACLSIFLDSLHIRWWWKLILYTLKLKYLYLPRMLHYTLCTTLQVATAVPQCLLLLTEIRPPKNTFLEYVDQTQILYLSTTAICCRNNNIDTTLLDRKSSPSSLLIIVKKVVFAIFVVIEKRIFIIIGVGKWIIGLDFGWNCHHAFQIHRFLVFYVDFYTLSQVHLFGWNIFADMVSFVQYSRLNQYMHKHIGYTISEEQIFHFTLEKICSEVKVHPLVRSVEVQNKWFGALRLHMVCIIPSSFLP